ncbi:outer membrane beta-barrel protein [Pedobacter mucosus]|uniref:outer membrane beta-barrel protein n=1 Tax=Pedobacter mucosus TaxID=2895286 RepID=UPI001EE3B5A0|nr:outer membrane beta-barrel protein [Pedobacter mucosus]UKT64369.1 PorT family protein [Pedobacter mucosus]
MKHLIFKTLLVSGLAGVMATGAFAQQDSTVKDTVIKKKSKYMVRIGGGNLISKMDSTKNAKKGRFVGGITFTRVDLGFSRLIDNGDFNLSPNNEFLDYKGGKTSTFSFDVLQFGYRVNSNFKVYVAGGFDWTLIRLRDNVTIQKNQPTLVALPENIAFSKNRFSSSYVHIPLNFEFRTNESKKGKRFYFVVGPEISFLLNGKVKQISDERGKEKQYDSYHFQSVRYGGTVRFGYGGMGLFTKYYFNDMFTTPAQAGLKNMSFGVSFGLN